MTNPEEVKEEKKSLNFIEAKVEEDLANGKNGGRVQTRFPPEPNGYLHIGHAKAICLDFGIAAQHGGVCNLRFDDTNPTKENMEYVDAIKEDIQWLGYQWGNEYYASDYFQQLWDFAIELIKRGKAYIDEQSSEEIAAQKGTPTQPGIESPYRNRPVEESLDLFNKMNNGEIGEGKMVLRAKIDMANPKCTSATRSSIAWSTRRTTARAPSGTPTRCMTLPMVRATTLRVSPTRSARSSLWCTARSTTSSSIGSRKSVARATTWTTTVRVRPSSTS